MTTTEGAAPRQEILVVDDTPANLDLLVSLLSEVGHKVRAAPNGHLALKSALSHPPSMLLLDVRMPGMDGFELCQKLKEDDRTRDIPIIFISGQNDVADRVRGFEVGGVDFIGKPFQRQEVLARVHAHLAIYQTQIELERRVSERTAALEYSLNQLIKTEERIRLDSEQQYILRELLELTLMGAPVEDTLGRCLDNLLTLSWLNIEPRGTIYLYDKRHQQLKLAASRNLPSTIVSTCTQVAAGSCLCGLALSSGQIQFAENNDSIYGTGSCGMAGHGHYCLPLVTNDEVVGVLSLHLASNGRRESNKEIFLTAVAGTLAGYIARKKGEQALTEHQAALEATIIERTADLTTNERRTRAIVTTMLETVIQIDRRGNMLFVNFAAEEMFGYTEDEMLGHNVSMLMPESIASAHDSYITRFLTTRQPRIIGKRSEITGRRKDGSFFPAEIAINEMVDDLGSTFLGVLRDMTSQKEAEQALTSALEIAHAATEAKSSFLANMSHEIRTPLNAVLGLARMGVRDYRNQGAGELFEKVRSSGKHLLDVVNDILDFSKIEAGKFNIEHLPFAIKDTINNVVNFVSLNAEEKSLALVATTPADLPEWVTGDELRVTQILTNLLSNAVKFTDRGFVTLRTKYHGATIDFAVEDSGTGMTEAQLKHIFQPFEQADSSITRSHGGTGLGLTISQKLARLMGGEITVKSTPGQGSCFTLTLPLPATDSPVKNQAEIAVSAEGELRLLGYSILAADDVELNRLILEDLVIHEGATITLAADGQQALDILNEAGANCFDVVLMDIQMPVLDGLEATRRIARIAPALPVIGLTAHAMAEEKARCLAAGMVDHVVKPVDADLLVKSIRRHATAKHHPHVPNSLKEQSGTTDKTRDDCKDPDYIDLDILTSRVGNDPAKLKKYTGLFINSARDTLSAMQSAQSRGDVDTLSMLGHRLKSAALTVGAMRFADLCHALENDNPGGEPENTENIVEEMLTLFKQIEQRVGYLLTTERM